MKETMRQKFFQTFLPALAAISALFSSCAKNTKTLAFEAMDTLVTISSDGSNADKANSLAKEEIDRIEKLISTTLPESEIYKINNSKSFPVKVSGETASLVLYAKNIADATDGALNPALYPVTKLWGFTTGEYRVPGDTEIKETLAKTDWRKIKVEFEDDADTGLQEAKFYNTKSASIFLEKGMEIDLGAIGKGYAGDMAAKILRQNGIKSAIINLGGNVQAVGEKSAVKDKDWRIGIKAPFPGDDSAIAMVKAKDMAVVTSGGYERYFIGDDGDVYIHIFSSKTGRPVPPEENSIASVTAVAKSGLYADSLSTALFAMGAEKAYLFWKNRRDFEYFAVFTDGSTYASEGLKDNLTLFF